MLGIREADLRFSSSFFCLPVRKYFVEQPFCAAFHKISGSENVYGSEGGVSRVSVETFLSHSVETFRRGILYCCKNFGYRKSLDKMGGKHDFSSKNFCLTVPKNFVGESFSVSSISGFEEMLGIRKGGWRFSVEFFLSQSTETIRRLTLLCCVSHNFR